MGLGEYIGSPFADSTCILWLDLLLRDNATDHNGMGMKRPI